MSIQQHVETLRELARKVAPELTQINDAKALQELRVKYMGKKGALAEIAKVMRELSAEERPMLGQVMNEVREEIELILTTHQKEIEARMLEAKLRLETVDVTLPGIKRTIGTRHIITQTMEEIEDLFIEWVTKL